MIENPCFYEDQLINGIGFDRDAGPVDPWLLNIKPKLVSCQYANQRFHFITSGIRFSKQQSYSAEGYLRYGLELADFNNIAPKEFFNELRAGTILYSERYRDKDGAIIYNSSGRKLDKYLWAKSLHIACPLGVRDHSEIFFPNYIERNFSCLPPDSQFIYHASGIDKKVSVWPLKRFLYYYKPVAIKLPDENISLETN